MTNELRRRIKAWVNDFEQTQPKNVEIDNDTFEGEAYFLLKACVSGMSKRRHCRSDGRGG